ncbi:hypothetical protein QSQ_2966 [Clostridioides difficile P32]|nr:hypothetical protein QAW_3210 [Clostridioides difficile CD17]EQE61559.1 hypothetical protein QCM_2952 [Clostridioides difficile CD46]EQH39935.1 hypothetical protein QMA_3015 [Clostridioides difficile DA00244]EQJ45216.1 hypothetical protein QSG_3303 [Clostridioides difficile P25]EQJ45557.1 hypothetical protein QSE_3249 [Clostridioides difficile P24]EQJ57705.1 hypothetical protein QSQ_2966 [Clostridioides difficile P32]
MQSFILTKWYVNFRYAEEEIISLNGFILTKWYVNVGF